METTVTLPTYIQSTSVGFLEALLNGLWPSEAELERAEQERLDRQAKTDVQ